MAVSDTFFQSVITIVALFVSVGGLMTMTSLREISAFELRTHQHLRVRGRVILGFRFFVGFPARALVVWLYLISLASATIAIVFSLLALAASSANLTIPFGFIGGVYFLLVLYGFFFVFSVSVNIGAVWGSG